MSKKVVAKKKFGQNFLKDETILHQIIQAMPNTSYPVAEIGPGLGDLTRYLVKIKSVKAFEVDTDLCQHLEQRFKEEINTKHFSLQCGDVLEHWKSNLLDEEYDLVANLPYYIATNIILKALADQNCKNILVMVQKEVALKFSAEAEKREFCALSIITQSVASASIVVDVPPSAFDPQPKVDSAVLLIRKSTNRDVESQENIEFELMLRAAFSQPRKTLIKNLSAKYNKTKLLELFNSLELDVKIRPHQLSTKLYHQLYTQL